MNIELIGVSSPEEFFQRFDATIIQKEKYTPLFLAICRSSYGELSPSFGIFTKKNQNQLYTVYGDECSMWDFNGQFKPELSSIDLIEKQALQKLGVVDGEYRFNTKLKQYLSYLNGLDIFPKAADNPEIQNYVEFIHSEFITSLPISQKEMALFHQQYHDHADEGIEFHSFQIKTNWGSTVNIFVNHNMELSCEPEMAKILSKNHPLIQNFISDLQGSIELQENIFSNPNTTKAKPRF